ncbi:helix-turn-helix domain-containing protein [Microvirga arsenatis]|uniref:Helix-turn-helix domain-containing protein n=1 Tax=Microvirga arsenatis TaxID=2692265 RepID=A0ABW9Z581_9HYPH|nr:helix-turn-helix domain-containing protein [Microvirga arsenatis]NBJ13094.1 helix-turn-helix domain-containing protein [Microvirga arsenatis]NBJ26845.1 helix-turn-helix domain-containing protein [Microvirga arsenatis]
MQTALPAPAIRGYAEPVRRAPEVKVLGATRVLAKDEELFGEGDRAAFFYKVVSGAIRTSKLLSDGRRQISAFHLPGDIFGIEAGDEHRFSAEAVDEATVIAYRRCSLESFASQDGAFACQVVNAMMRSLERAQDHMMLLGRKSALEKIATFLLDLAERLGDDHVDLPMSRTDIADHLGITIETVSRTLTQLERQNIIELPAHRRSIQLTNKAALRRLDS